MRTREEAARFVEQQFGDYICPRQKPFHFHIGMQEIRELMDFIYEGPPATDAEGITHPYPQKLE